MEPLHHGHDGPERCLGSRTTEQGVGYAEAERRHTVDALKQTLLHWRDAMNMDLRAVQWAHRVCDGDFEAARIRLGNLSNQDSSEILAEDVSWESKGEAS